ncbi:hypothetical protein GCM10017576_26550 [Microbacterium barkeri]|uniref:Uncharacterized protein n=1 Tax=Microbacterium barkeri TaxID=33917 RepID=A0A9W6H5U0_9MICO|nr:hypothetical protein GCM10017576_26550 [Microbacterium barkeri]
MHAKRALSQNGTRRFCRMVPVDAVTGGTASLVIALYATDARGPLEDPRRGE